VTVLILEKVPVGLRGELSRWMLEAKTGVFVGRVTASVRDLLWEKACQGAKGGGCMMVHRAKNEQGFAIRIWGDTSRVVEDFEGLALIRIPS
jgi:CRISPR-associated protein Cas2